VAVGGAREPAHYDNVGQDDFADDFAFVEPLNDGPDHLPDDIMDVEMEVQPQEEAQEAPIVPAMEIGN